MLSLGQSGRIASSCFREAAFPGRPRRSGHRDALAPFLHFPHLTFPYFPYSVIGSLTNSMVSDRHDQRAHSDLQNDAGLQKLTSLNKSPPNHRNASQPSHSGSFPATTGSYQPQSTNSATTSYLLPGMQYAHLADIEQSAHHLDIDNSTVSPPCVVLQHLGVILPLHPRRRLKK
jgi:hypothetical protein